MRITRCRCLAERLHAVRCVLTSCARARSLFSIQKRHEAQSLKEVRDFMKGLASYQLEHQALRVRTCFSEAHVSIA